MGIVDVSSYDNFLIFLIPKSGFDRRHDAKSELLHQARLLRATCNGTNRHYAGQYTQCQGL